MEEALNFDEIRRMNERKNYQKEVSFSTNSLILPATLKNVSMGGALVSTINLPKLKTGTEIIITVPFATQKGGIKRKAIVRWVENDQFGIEFI
jgi:hypothetical protein